jgi:DnaJ-domain-containing protein 1
MDATSLRISQDILSGEAEIVFDRGGQRYMFRCDKYADVLDNLRAAQLTIVYLWRALEEYGVLSDSEALDQAFSQFFLGFAAMPDDSVLLLSSGQDWWSVLGVDPGADKRTIVNAFRSLAKVHHPDAGGDPNDFKRLRRAYEEAINYQ